MVDCRQPLNTGTPTTCEARDWGDYLAVHHYKEAKHRRPGPRLMRPFIGSERTGVGTHSRVLAPSSRPGSRRWPPTAASARATILHRTLTNLFLDRGMRIDHTYQLNTGGNTDFLNMLERERLADKKTSKTEAVTSMIEARGQSIAPDDIHIGPSDYVPWQKDNKICFLRIESTHFGDVSMNLEVRLSVEDSPNSAGVAIDSIRCCKLALDNGLSGAIIEPAAFFSKHPPKQIEDRQARELVEAYITKYGHND
jgi:hypothetical protein